MSEHRIRIWKGRNPDGEDYTGEPDEVITLEAGEPHVWQTDPHYHSPPIGLDIHPDDCPATLEVYTSDSVHDSSGRQATNYVDESYWNGPMERGLTYPDSHDYRPFGCEIWGRILFFIPDE